MKKLIAAALAVSLLAGLSGCNRNTKTEAGGSTETTLSPQPTPTQASTDASTEAPTQLRQLPMVAVSLPVLTQDYTADDGTLVYSHTYQNISLTLPEPEVADKVIIDFLNRTDLQSIVDTIYASALSDHTQAYFTGPYWTQITYEPMRIDSGVLSMFGSYAEYKGGMHPGSVGKAVTYDLVTGDVLTLADILAENAGADTLCQLVFDALGKQSQQLYTGFETTVAEILGKPLEDIDNWYLSTTGLCFCFSPYEIGPYSSGIITAQIPYGELTGILSDAYFPAEREHAAGTVLADSFDEADLDAFTQFTELVLTQEGQNILLHSEQGIYDIRLETGTWSADGQTFTPEHTVFAACSLTPGDAITVQAAFDTQLPGLRLSYTSNDENISCFLHAQDGSVTLTEN